MSSRTMSAERSPLITEADYDRLNHLADSPVHRASQAALLSNLKQDLSRREVVSAMNVPKSVVTMHSQVRLRDLEDEEAETFTLVYPDAANIAEGKLSVLAPMGVALLGAREGHIIQFKAPGGVRRCKVMKIVYQPETAGDFHL